VTSCTDTIRRLKIPVGDALRIALNRDISWYSTWNLNDYNRAALVWLREDGSLGTAPLILGTQRTSPTICTLERQDPLLADPTRARSPDDEAYR